MRVLRHQAGHPAKSEARAQAIDEMRELGRMVGCRKAGLQRIAALGRERRKAHDIEAEAGIASISDGGEPLGEQRADALGIAQRRAGSNRGPKNLAVGAEQRDLEPAGAFATPLQHAGKLLPERFDGAEHVGFEQDRIGEAALRHISGERQARRDRLVLASERLVDAADELRPETGSERRCASRETSKRA